MNATDLIAELKRRRRDALWAFAMNAANESAWLLRLSRLATAIIEIDESKLWKAKTGLPDLDANLTRINSLTETLDWIAQEQENDAAPDTVTMTVGECRERDEYERATASVAGWMDGEIVTG